MPSVSITFLHLNNEGEPCEDTIEAEVKVSGGSPGQYYGPPERCYPAEDPDVEFAGGETPVPDSCATCDRMYADDEKLSIKQGLDLALAGFDVEGYLTDERLDWRSL